MKQYDLIVAGGGISGVAAAVSAAREGLAVLLIEKTGTLGGAMSDSLVYPFMRYRMKTDGRSLSDGIFTEMRRRHEAYADPSFEHYKCVFDDLVKESGAQVLFHADVFAAAARDRRITQVEVNTTAGVLSFAADYFVDATGDGALLFLAGCDYQLGREEDGLCQPMTTCFRLGGVDLEAFGRDKARIQETYRAYRLAGKLSNPRENILTFQGLGDGVVHFNTTRVVMHNPVDPFALSQAELLGRKQVEEMIAFLRQTSEAFRNCTLIALANRIGVRESRKLKGAYILTESDLANCVSFEDTIALGNYQIDIHNPAGTGTEIIKIPEDRYYQIPYRCLVPKEYDNLLAAGRCISATHRAHSAIRIMPICACLGQAAGTAAALAHGTKSAVQTIDIRQLRARLLEAGAAI